MDTGRGEVLMSEAEKRIGGIPYERVEFLIFVQWNGERRWPPSSVRGSSSVYTRKRGRITMAPV